MSETSTLIASDLTWDNIATTVEKLPEMFAEARGDLGLSLRDVSAACGVPINSLSRLERNLGHVRTDTVVKVLRWLAANDETFTG